MPFPYVLLGPLPHNCTSCSRVASPVLTMSHLNSSHLLTGLILLRKQNTHQRKVPLSLGSEFGLTSPELTLLTRFNTGYKEESRVLCSLDRRLESGRKEAVCSED